MKKEEITLGLKVVESSPRINLAKSPALVDRGTGVIISPLFKTKNGSSAVKVAWANGQTTEVSIARIASKHKHDIELNRILLSTDIRQAIELLQQLCVADNIAQDWTICVSFCEAALRQISENLVSNPDSAYCLKAAVSRLEAISPIARSQVHKITEITEKLQVVIRILSNNGSTFDREP